MRIRALVYAIAWGAGLLTAAPSADAQVGPTTVEECMANGGDPRFCRGLGHLVELFGVLCRETGVAGSCTEIDGRDIGEELVAAHEKSPLARALALQRALDDDEPLHEELWAHTHNSYNADAYEQTFYGLDPNQLYSITDQLRMGIRAIEIDIHWAESTSADPAQGGKAVVVCHGARIPGAQQPNVDFGCGVRDPLLIERLQEVRAWLDEPKNKDEVLMIYLENQLDDDLAAHAQAAAAIDEAFGDLVYMPVEPGSCEPLPMDTSRGEIRDAEKRILITGNCGPAGSPWNARVHQRGPRWIESGLGFGDDYPSYPCQSERATKNYDVNWIRYWGDETGLSNGAGQGGDVTLNDARNMVRCGVNMIGLDNLVPFDERLAKLVWSWAPDEPKLPGGCAYQGADGFFFSGDCKQHRRFACYTGVAWIVTGPALSWKHGPRRCEDAGAVFDVPPNGWQNELLVEAKVSGEVWLDYADLGLGWVPNAS